MHPYGVVESSTSFGWGKGGNVTSAGWQVTLCDPIWHVSSRSGVATLRTAAIHLLLTYNYRIQVVITLTLLTLTLRLPCTLPYRKNPNHNRKEADIRDGSF